MKDYSHNPGQNRPSVAQQSVEMGVQERAQQAKQQEKLNEERKKRYEELYINEYMAR